VGPKLTRKDFDDPRLEWRRLFGEFFGTFFLVVVAAGAGVVNAVSLGEVGRVAAVVAPGVMVMAIILFMGAVSGAHLNPAVTIGFAARGGLSLEPGTGVHRRPTARRDHRVRIPLADVRQGRDDGRDRAGAGGL